MGCTGSSAGASPGTKNRKADENGRTVFSGEQGIEFHKCYSLGKKLGAGAFAQVRIAIRIGAAQDEETADRAVKILDLRDVEGADNQQQPAKDAIKELATTHEVKVWEAVMKAKSPYCMELYDVFYDDACCYLVMERCASSLYTHLNSLSMMKEKCVGHLFHQMVQALHALQTVGVLHRDIKPDNFLVNAGPTIKLGDFGLSVVQKAKGETPTNRGVAGTAPFMSPEMLRGQGYSHKTDIWSLGVLMYCLLFGNFPYYAQEKSSKAMKLAIKDGLMVPTFRITRKLAQEEDLPSPSTLLLSVVKNMLDRDQLLRPSAADLLANPYWKLVEGNAAKVSNQEDVASPQECYKPLFRAAVKAGAFQVIRHKDCDPKNPTDAWLSNRSSLTRSSSSTSRMPSWFGSGARMLGSRGRDEACGMSGTSTATSTATSSVTSRKGMVSPANSAQRSSLTVTSQLTPTGQRRIIHTL